MKSRGFMKYKNFEKLVLISILFFGFPFIFAFGQTSSAPISFTKKEIAFFKWGSGEKETQWHSTRIQIDGNDNVYFFNGNGQILIVSSDGSAIKVIDGEKVKNICTVDAEGNIYTVDYEKKGVPVLIITKPGGSQTKYENFEFSHEENGIAYDVLNKTLAVTSNDDKPEKLPPYLLGNKNKPDYEMKGKNLFLFHMNKINKHLKKINRQLNVDSVQIKIPKKWNLSCAADFLGVDDNGNFYFLCGYGYGPHYADPWVEGHIKIYSASGVNISEIKLDLNYVGEQVSDNELKLDIHGNIYQSWTSKDGLHILKWLRN